MSTPEERERARNRSLRQIPSSVMRVRGTGRVQASRDGAVVAQAIRDAANRRTRLHWGATEPELSTKDLALRWGMSVPTIHHLRHRGEAPPAILVGRELRFRLSDVEGWERARLPQQT